MVVFQKAIWRFPEYTDKSFAKFSKTRAYVEPNGYPFPTCLDQYGVLEQYIFFEPGDRFETRLENDPKDPYDQIMVIGKLWADHLFHQWWIIRSSGQIEYQFQNYKAVTLKGSERIVIHPKDMIERRQTM